MTVIGIERIRDELSKLKPELKKPWVILDRLPYIHATDDPNAKPYSTPVVGRFDYMESADYIMACNPDAMSNVLSYVAALKSEIERLKELADSEGTRAVEYLRRARKAEAEIKQLRKDAERYRWLTRTSDTNKFMVCDTDNQILYFGWEADEAIDAAIANAIRKGG
jgi:hypothetical protein